jgi:hypothetical protein
MENQISPGLTKVEHQHYRKTDTLDKIQDMVLSNMMKKKKKKKKKKGVAWDL